MSGHRVAGWLWDGVGVGARTARVLLAPLSWLFRGVVWIRSAYFDRVSGVPARCPSVSVGNLTVGGTGKTPVAAWFIQRLTAQGGRPAIVMRGVGDDEAHVHAAVNPGTLVIADPDRVAGMAAAIAQGADCVVLDDAFQHRRAARTVDVVLVSADRWPAVPRLLPVGPFREPLTALRRAGVVAITAKAATSTQVSSVERVVHASAPGVPVAVIRLMPDGVRRWDGDAEGHGTAWLAGRSLVLTSGIGDPTAFERQVRAAGTQVDSVHHFPDHHRFSDIDVQALVTAAAGTDGVLCTLKDAVKLGPLWPRIGPSLWYLSQTVVVEQGADELESAVARVLAKR